MLSRRSCITKSSKSSSTSAPSSSPEIQRRAAKRKTRPEEIRKPSSLYFQKSTNSQECQMTTSASQRRAILVTQDRPPQSSWLGYETLTLEARVRFPAGETHFFSFSVQHFIDPCTNWLQVRSGSVFVVKPGAFGTSNIWWFSPWTSRKHHLTVVWSITKECSVVLKISKGARTFKLGRASTVYPMMIPMTLFTPSQPAR